MVCSKFIECVEQLLSFGIRRETNYKAYSQ